MARNNRDDSNRGRNNNPEGRNQHSSAFNWDTARSNPVTTAAVVGAAAAAGAFLWSRRNQISEQLSNLNGQIGEWTANFTAGDKGREIEPVGGGSEFSSAAGIGAAAGQTGNAGRGTQSKSRSTRGAAGMSETGGSDAALGAQTEGGMSNAPSGRSRS